MKSYSATLKISLAILVIFAIAIILFVAPLMRQPKLSEHFISGNGRTEATEVDITTKYGGRLEQVIVKEGNQVKTKDILARIDTRELEAQLRRAQAELSRTEQEKRFAIAVIAQRQSELSLARKEVKRFEGLYENDSISLEQLQRGETAMETARAALAAARAQLANAEAAIEAAIANTELIKTQIDDSALRAPISGQVLYRLAEPGEVLPGGGKVLTVIDPTDITMTLFVPTQAVARVAVGAQARIVLDGISNFVIPAKVSFVAPRSQFTPKEVETRTEREKLMFRIKIQLDVDFLNTHSALAKAGIPGIAYIRLDPEALWPEHLTVRELKAGSPK